MSFEELNPQSARLQKRLDREEAARAAAEEARNAPMVEETAAEETAAEDTAAEAGATDETALDASEATSGTESP